MPGGPDDNDPITTEPCDHRYQARNHDPGVKLRHLSQIRYATCTGIACRRPSIQADFEHTTSPTTANYARWRGNRIPWLAMYWPDRIDRSSWVTPSG